MGAGARQLVFGLALTAGVASALVGSALVGLTQAVVLERQVAAAEQANRRTYFRYKGSQGMRTVLAALRRG